MKFRVPAIVVILCGLCGCANNATPTSTSPSASGGVHIRTPGAKIDIEPKNVTVETHK